MGQMISSLMRDPRPFVPVSVGVWGSGSVILTNLGGLGERQSAKKMAASYLNSLYIPHARLVSSSAAVSISSWPVRNTKMSPGKGWEM